MIRARCGNRINTRSKPSSDVSSEHYEDTLATVFEAGIPSMQELPVYLQPVAPPEVVSHDVWKLAPGEDSATTPEPGSLVLCASGMMLILASAAWQWKMNCNERS